MSVTVDATIGGPSANSYQSVADVTAYFATHLYPTVWEEAALETDQQAKAVIYATRLLETWMTWGGTKATEAQALSQPRIGLYDRHGELVAEDTIAQEILAAHAELSQYVLTQNPTAQGAQGLASITTPAVSLSFDIAQQQGGTIPDFILALISHLGVTRGRYALQVRTLRV